MEKIERAVIDWEKTGKRLKLLRNDNLNLRRYCCRQLGSGKRYDGCDNANCDTCIFEMDTNISQAELAKVFSVSESMVVNWENNKSKPSLEDLIFYSRICGIDLFDIIVFAE